MLVKKEIKFIYSEKASKFGKSPPIICPMYCQSNDWWKFCKILWPSQNILILRVGKNGACTVIWSLNLDLLLIDLTEKNLRPSCWPPSQLRGNQLSRQKSTLFTHKFLMDNYEVVSLCVRSIVILKAAEWPKWLPPTHNGRFNTFLFLFLLQLGSFLRRA